MFADESKKDENSERRVEYEEKVDEHEIENLVFGSMRDREQEARYPREAHYDAHLRVELDLAGQFGAREPPQLALAVCTSLLADAEYGGDVEEGVD